MRCRTLRAEAILGGENAYQRLYTGKYAPFCIDHFLTSKGEGPREERMLEMLRAWNQAAGVHTEDVEPWKAWREYVEPSSLAVSEYGMLIMTRSGFFGFAPPGVGSGDLVVLPHRSRFPIALRRSVEHGQKWTFQGLLWVHGIMEMELGERAPGLTLKELVFDLV